MQVEIAKELIKPRRIDAEKLSERYGKFVAGPLERGYGITIGNSLRRILLSSLPGAAITAVSIEGVKHEFSTIPGVVEDITEIVLNLKEVILDLHGKEQVTLRLDASGAGEVTAGQITGDVNVEIINPDHHIATLNTDGKLAIEITARTGRGYVVSENFKEESDPLGTIVLDAVFSPVRKVNHIITNARVGQTTDYDKLTLEIWTDGSVSPEDAIKNAAGILRDQLNVFAGVEEVKAEEEAPVEENKPKFNENLFRRIDELELSVRSSNCLENADIKYIGELVIRSEGDMLRTKNFGRKSLNEIKEILTEMGLHLGMPIENFPSREELDKMHEANEGIIIE